MRLRTFVTGACAALALACSAAHPPADPTAYDAGPLPDGGVTAPSADAPVALMGRVGQMFGDSLAFADLDGDGLDDLILANRANSDAFTPFRGGSIVIVYGRHERLHGVVDLASESVEIIGPAHETGAIYLARGDYDGDGLDDVALGVSASSGEGASLHVLFGSHTRITGTPFVEDVTATFLAPTDARGSWAEPIANAGDLDGDGVDDLFVGALTANPPTIAVLHGSRTRWTGTRSFAADTTFTGTQATPGVLPFSGAGDVDGDGHDDALVGEIGGDGSLRLGVFYGPITETRIAVESAPAHVVTLSGEWLGVLGGFDANGDGLSDFVVPGSAAVGGSLHLFLGSRTRLAGDVGPARGQATLEGASDDARAGASISAGDADGDGLDDLLVGSPNFSGAIGRADRVYGMPRSQSLASAADVWIGRERSDPSGRGGTLHEVLGASVAQDGDFDGDGYADALLGAPSNFLPNGGFLVYFVYGAVR